jgi:hypothetical protein
VPVDDQGREIEPDERRDPRLLGHLARPLETGGIQLHAHSAHAGAPDGGDHDPAVAAAEVVDDVTRAQLGEPQHALDDLGWGLFVRSVRELRSQDAGREDDGQRGK